MGLRPSAISFGPARGPLRALQSPACIDGVAPKREAAVTSTRWDCLVKFRSGSKSSVIDPPATGTAWDSMPGGRRNRTGGSLTTSHPAGPIFDGLPLIIGEIPVESATLRYFILLRFPGRREAGRPEQLLLMVEPGRRLPRGRPWPVSRWPSPLRGINNSPQ